VQRNLAGSFDFTVGSCFKPAMAVNAMAKKWS